MSQSKSSEGSTSDPRHDPHRESASYPSLQNKIVFITGGASGIGAAMVELFCMQGAKVAFIDIDTESAAQLVAKMAALTSVTPWFQQVDVTQAEELQSSIADASRHLGPVEVLINNVANDMRHEALEMTVPSWRKCMAVNLDACFYASQAAAKIMQANQGGSIINLSSINAILGPPNMAGYVTAKAGVNGLTKALATDFGADNIRVNAILPGWVATERQLETWLTADAEAEFSKQVALKGRIQASDVAKLALFLAAADSSMITGQCFTIDAGRT